MKVVSGEDIQPVYTCCCGCEGNAHVEVKGTSSTAVSADTRDHAPVPDL